jgi:hypothetical protein
VALVSPLNTFLVRFAAAREQLLWTIADWAATHLKWRA